MTDQSRIRFPQFYITSPQPCPYLEGRYEKKVFTHLLGDEPVSLNNTLTQAGFRRSQNIAYRPACEDCQACISVRVVVNEFRPGRTYRRILARNEDLRGHSRAAAATDEQYGLLRRYLDARHADGGMADMTGQDYKSMVEDTTIHTNIVEYRRRASEPGETAPLLAAALTDTLDDGLSMVYSLYDPDARGLAAHRLTLLIFNPAHAKTGPRRRCTSRTRAYTGRELYPFNLGMDGRNPAVPGN